MIKLSRTAAVSSSFFASQSPEKAAVGISIYFRQRRIKRPRFRHRLIRMPLHVGPHPVQAPNFIGANPSSLRNRMLDDARLVVVCWAHYSDRNLRSANIGTVVQLVANLGRRSALTDKCSRSAEALVNLRVGK